VKRLICLQIQSGIRFDSHLTFKNQLLYLKDACLKRLNILKVLSNKKWGLTIKTLTDIYKSLIRSLLDYSSIIYPYLSTSSIDMPERIQIRCLKIIHKKHKFESAGFIKNLPDYQQIVKRFDYLNINYIKKV
jgi:hypothetical protein